ncbi:MULTISPECIES: hypothetical protein [unclassified Streptomyces]|uniref:hypothetical protein n=1 Tax=unclassified Streptomyces TaxID=2593676 RepID=UPI00035F9BE3|nr:MULTISPECIES: hypothetical protein [unclassified Streptomyces]MYX32249.1 hypothetical protein [Streptomyces sp. SID8377]
MDTLVAAVVRLNIVGPLSLVEAARGILGDCHTAVGALIHADASALRMMVAGDLSSASVQAHVHVANIPYEHDPSIVRIDMARVRELIADDRRRIEEAFPRLLKGMSSDSGRTLYVRRMLYDSLATVHELEQLSDDLEQFCPGHTPFDGEHVHPAEAVERMRNRADEAHSARRAARSYRDECKEKIDEHLGHASAQLRHFLDSAAEQFSQT